MYSIMLIPNFDKVLLECSAMYINEPYYNPYFTYCISIKLRMFWNLLLCTY